MPGMPGMPGAGAGAAPPSAPAAPTFKPGQEVVIRGLQKAPQLNGKKALVVPPTPEEKEKIQGTNRLIVRILDDGQQFAVKPDNLRTKDQEVDELMSKDIEDVSIYNPSLQAKAK